MDRNTLLLELIHESGLLDTITAADLLVQDSNVFDSQLDKIHSLGKHGLLGLCSVDIEPLAKKTLSTTTITDICLHIERVVTGKHQILSQTLKSILSAKYRQSSSISSQVKDIQDRHAAINIRIKNKRIALINAFLSLNDTSCTLFKTLVALIKDYKHSRMVERQELMARYSALLLTSMALKVESVKCQLLVDLKNQDDAQRNPYLIVQHMRLIKDSLYSKALQIDSKLAEYEAVGPSFLKIVEEHTKLKNEIQKIAEHIDLLQSPADHDAQHMKRK